MKKRIILAAGFVLMFFSLGKARAQVPVQQQRQPLQQQQSQIGPLEIVCGCNISTYVACGPSEEQASIYELVVYGTDCADQMTVYYQGQGGLQNLSQRVRCSQNRLLIPIRSFCFGERAPFPVKIFIHGEGGNDRIDVSGLIADPSSINPGEDILEVNLFGGSGADQLMGSQLRDVIHAQGGNDDVWGNGGNDTIYGGAGNDRICGGLGEDYLRGGNNDDHIFGDNCMLWGGILYQGEGIGDLTDIDRDNIGGGAGQDCIEYSVIDERTDGRDDNREGHCDIPVW